MIIKQFKSSILKDDINEQLWQLCQGSIGCVASNTESPKQENWSSVLECVLESWRAYQHEEDSKDVLVEDEEINPETYLQNWVCNFNPDMICAQDLMVVRIQLPRVW